MTTRPILPLIRELMECAQAFERLSAGHIRQLGLTPAQFDIIATLGNTPGMCCSALGRNTLITKGTLTGVLDRLEQRGLLTRAPSPSDGRSVIVALTAEGQALFERVFPEHGDYLLPAFDPFSDEELLELRRRLAALRHAFASRQQPEESPVP